VALPDAWGVYIFFLRRCIVEVRYTSGILRWEEVVTVIEAAAELSGTLRVLIANEKIVCRRNCMLRRRISQSETIFAGDSLLHASLTITGLTISIEVFGALKNSLSI
jgi:hypothetical protein